MSLRKYFKVSMKTNFNPNKTKNLKNVMSTRGITDIYFSFSHLNLPHLSIKHVISNQIALKKIDD